MCWRFRVALQVTGRVVDVKKPGELKGGASIALQLTNLNLGGNSYSLATDVFNTSSPGKGGYTAGNTVGAAALGAAIGAVAGGGPGAAIGAVAGTGVGLGASAATPGPRSVVPPEVRAHLPSDQPGHRAAGLLSGRFPHRSECRSARRVAIRRRPTAYGARPAGYAPPPPGYAPYPYAYGYPYPYALRLPAALRVRLSVLLPPLEISRCDRFTRGPISDAFRRVQKWGRG